LLTKYGGLWTDASVFCTTPLKEWLPIVGSGSFFAYDKKNNRRPLSNWLLYSKGPEGYIVNNWLNASVEYLRTHKRDKTYFWPQEVFQSLLNRDVKFHALWKSVPKLSAHPPHFLQSIFDQPVSNESNGIILRRDTYVVKLTWRFPNETACFDEGVVGRFLFDFHGLTCQDLQRRPLSQFASGSVALWSMTDIIDDLLRNNSSSDSDKRRLLLSALSPPSSFMQKLSNPSPPSSSSPPPPLPPPLLPLPPPLPPSGPSQQQGQLATLFSLATHSAATGVASWSYLCTILLLCIVSLLTMRSYIIRKRQSQ
jgi:hypothetical protein